ncbi:MAG: cytochrome c biosis protein CcmG, thiol:disulfide interchange protein DsbE [Gaiellaceae bacterium]|jgi:cytochrome c biogenesis protein CcmG/thiol:disulfide interchange protein DsbE|nr:cytochrome c biosis protein CcmG, thiol:disulfide interchange protein DsbE [Gaiellaceae bacterium]
MRNARLTGQVVALAAVAALLGVLVWHLAHQPRGPKIGGPAPDFSLSRLDRDGMLALSSLRGKPVVLNFWASWCVPCKREAATLERLSHRYKSRGVVFVGVDANDSATDARRFIRAHGVTYPIVFDENGVIAADGYNALNMPVTYFVDRAGRLVESRVLGPVSEKEHADQFRRGVEAAIGS